MSKIVIMVAGYDYERKGVSFRTICENRYKRLVKAKGVKNDAAWKFVIFDVGAGVISRNELKGKKRAWKDDTTFSFSAVTAANYTGYTFDKKQAGVMSVVDVYDYIRKLGKNDPGSVVELSFFSHGYYGGPILVNSNDNSGAGTVARDPDDKDARTDKDFSAPNMDAAQLQALQKAFAKDAFLWIWGCVFTHSYFYVLDKIVRRKKKAKKFKDAEKLDLEFDDSRANEIYDDDTTFFPAKQKGKYPTKFTRTFKQIKEFFQRGLDDTYFVAAANATSVPCYGALPGTYSTYEDNDRSIKNPLMRIPTANPPYADDFTRHIKFYTNYLKVTPDPEQRGYGRFDP